MKFIKVKQARAIFIKKPGKSEAQIKVLVLTKGQKQNQSVCRVFYKPSCANISIFSEHCHTNSFLKCGII